MTPKEQPKHTGGNAQWAGSVLAALTEAALWNAGYWVALTTGMRPGELLALRGCNIDRHQRVIHVPCTIIRHTDGAVAIGTTPRGGTPRIVTLADSTPAMQWRRGLIRTNAEFRRKIRPAT